MLILIFYQGICIFSPYLVTFFWWESTHFGLSTTLSLRNYAILIDRQSFKNEENMLEAESINK